MRERVKSEELMKKFCINSTQDPRSKKSFVANRDS
jgi:hypothetical protein